MAMDRQQHRICFQIETVGSLARPLKRLPSSGDACALFIQISPDKFVDQSSAVSVSLQLYATFAVGWIVCVQAASAW